MNLENKNRYYVYFHRRIDTGEIFYVGKGSTRRAWSKQGRNKHWQNIVNKAGYIVELKAVELDEHTSFRFEIFLIKHLRKHGVHLVNMSDGGEGPSGFTMPESAKKKISLAKIGTKHSEESRAKMRMVQAGHDVTDNAIYLISKTKTGSKLSECTKRKLSLLAKERYSCDAYKLNQYKFVKPDTNVYNFVNISGETFTGTRKELTEKHGLAGNEICKLFGRKPRRSVKGWKLLGLVPVSCNTGSYTDVTESLKHP